MCAIKGPHSRTQIGRQRNKHMAIPTSGNLESDRFDDYDPAFVSALGRLTIDFSSLEEMLRESIWWILGGNEERAQIMTSGLSFQVLLEKWAALFAQKFDHLLLPEPASKLRIQLLSINERRNRLVHAMWVLDVGTGLSVAERRRAKAGVGIDWQVDEVEIASVLTLLADIHGTIERLTDLTLTGDDAFKAIGPRRRR